MAFNRTMCPAESSYFINLVLFLCSLSIGFLLNRSASRHQCLERFGIIEKQTVIDHVLIVGSQFGQRIVIRYKLEFTGDGSVIVDGIAVRVFFCKEHALVIGNCTGEGFVRDGCGGEAGGIQSRHVVPVTREAVTTRNSPCAQKT